MMSRIARFAVLVAALASLFAVMSSTAGAVTWHNTGDTAFTATSNAGTLTSTAVTLGCAGADGIGSVTGGSPFVGNTLNVDATIGFTSCTLSGQTVSVECGVTLTGTAWDSGTPAVTTGTADVTCGVYLTGTKICHIEGNVHGHYINASGTTPGVLTVTPSSNLTLTNGAAGTCPLGNGDKGSLTHLSFNVEPDAAAPFGPILTRTA
jgi:hypothetical protein